MKAVQLSDEGFAVVAAALEAQGEGALMVVDLLSARRGPDSPEVQAELAKFEHLASAARELHGISTWRSNGGRTLPAGSIFQPRGEVA